MNIRVATPSDAVAVRAIYAPIVEGTAISFETAVPSAEEIAERIASRRPAYPWLVAEEAGGVAGYAYAGRFAERAAYGWSVETSAYVSEGARGQRLGKGLYTALIEILRAQGYVRAMAGITLPNPASVGLHRAMGFSLVGVYQAVGWKLGRWRDVAWWQRGLAEASASPARPIKIERLDPVTLSSAFAAGEALTASP